MKKTTTFKGRHSNKQKDNQVIRLTVSAVSFPSLNYSQQTKFLCLTKQ